MRALSLEGGRAEHTSSSKTFLVPSAVNLLANTQPAVPPPTSMKSYFSAAGFSHLIAALMRSACLPALPAQHTEARLWMHERGGSLELYVVNFRVRRY